MEFTSTQIPDVVVIDPVVYEDARGFLMETWRANKFDEAGIDAHSCKMCIAVHHKGSSWIALPG